MSKSVINEGDIVRVLAPGEFYDQEVEVLTVDRKGLRVWYQLDVTWNGTPRPSWFEPHEVTKVEEEEGK